MKKRGRKKGDKVGEGTVQAFFREKGGKQFLEKLYQEFQSADAIATYIFRRYNFFCSGNTIRIIMKSYNIPLNSHGGDRRSIKIKNLINLRGEQL